MGCSVQKMNHGLESPGEKSEWVMDLGVIDQWMALESKAEITSAHQHLVFKKGLEAVTVSPLSWSDHIRVI